MQSQYGLSDNKPLKIHNLNWLETEHDQKE